MPTTPRTTVARALLICTLATTPALAQPRVEVLIERAPLGLRGWCSVDANRLVVTDSRPGSPADSVGLLDLTTGAIEQVGFNALRDSAWDTGPTARAFIYHADAEARRTLWEVTYRPNYYYVPFTPQRWQRIATSEAWVRREDGTWLALHGGDAWLSQLSGDGLRVVGIVNYYSESIDEPGWPTNRQALATWSTQTGERHVVRIMPGTARVTGVSHDGTAAVLTARRWTDSATTYSVLLWREQDGPALTTVFESTPPNNGYEDLYAILSGDGNVVFLRSWSQGNKIYRWTSQAGLEELALPPGASGGQVLHTSYDGSRATGQLSLNATPVNYGDESSLWTLGGGFVSLNESMRRQGLPVLETPFVVDLSARGSSIMVLHGPCLGCWFSLNLSRVSDIFCDPLDFNNDGVFPDAQDAEDYLAVLAGGPGACSTGVGNCNDLDFNNDAVTPDDADLAAFLRRLGGGSCDE